MQQNVFMMHWITVKLDLIKGYDRVDYNMKLINLLSNFGTMNSSLK